LSVLGAVNINQLPLSALSLGSALQQAVPNPFFGVADAGALAAQATIARGQLLRPYPQFLDVRAANMSAGFARYHSLVLKYERRLRNGFGSRVNYTWSNNKDNLFGQTNFLDATVSTPLNNYDLGAEYSPSVATAPHRLVLTGMYQLPFGNGRRFLTGGGMMDALFGGWQVTAFGTYQSGFPLSISQNNNNAGTFAAAEPGSGRRSEHGGVEPRSHQRLARSGGVFGGRAVHARRCAPDARRTQPVDPELGHRRRQVAAGRRRRARHHPPRADQRLQHHRLAVAGHRVRPIDVRPHRRPGGVHASAAVHIPVGVVAFEE
jgi:hypothetical protein